MRYLILLFVFVLGTCSAPPPVEPKPTDPLDAAVKYYLSEERRKQFDGLLDYLEKVPGQAMLEQRIPSVIYQDAPGDPELWKWIRLQTRPREGWPFISFNTRRDAYDKADIRSSQGFATHRCGDDFSFNTADYLTLPTTKTRAKAVSLGPYSYFWSSIIQKRNQPDERAGLLIRLRGGEIPPDEPLQPTLSLYEIQDYTGKRVAVDEIRKLNLTFITDVRGLDLNNSQCTESD